MNAVLNTENNTFNNTEAVNQTIRQVKIGKDNFKVISIFTGQKTSSELVYNAAVKKILHENEE